MNDIEKDIAAAMEQDLKQRPHRGPGKPVERVLSNPVPDTGQPSKRAVDQLSAALAGLLRVEEELNQLTGEITGHPDDHQPIDKTVQPEGLPMFDRVRADATALAELAIRMHAKITHARSRL